MSRCAPHCSSTGKSVPGYDVDWHGERVHEARGVGRRNDVDVNALRGTLEERSRLSTHWGGALDLWAAVV